jgi:GAF domain-containing protein
VGITDPLFEEWATSFAQTARALFAGRSVEGTVARVVELATPSIGAIDAVSVTLLEGGTPYTPITSNAVATRIDHVQYGYSEGPCLDAIEKETMTYSEDLGSDPRWPLFGPAADSLGMKSLLSCRLTSDRTLGSLNLYARSPRAFGDEERVRAGIFATQVGLALDAAIARDKEVQRSRDLEAALVSRSVIGQAQGILMERQRWTDEQAFATLTRVSQKLNLKLREVAQYLVDTGEVPEVSAR